MSWDIYGNPLRRGYCEVHPDVHQEYPCSICMAQKQQQSQPHNELEQLQYEFAQQGDYIRHLESERAALSTQVESLLDDRKAFVKKEFELLKEVERLEIELKKRDEQNAALAAQVRKLKHRKTDTDLLRALFYAPSSPVSPDKAHEIEVWYGKFKQVALASKEVE